ncbi:MAG TPA: Rrf2 family transcriptional regulator [Thiohalobacter sp.]|nr:Rrf2 family transcriptional regulator [Thiohalobacter sp.]
MRLSTKGRYAVTAMMDLAVHQDSGPVTLAEISRCQGISLSYLEQLFAKLRRQGLVKGVRGPGGGYRLAKSPRDISVADIIQAVDEKVDTTLCEGQENCQGGKRCLTHELWDNLSQQIYDYLAQINLEEFLSRPSVREVIERQGEGGHRKHEQEVRRFTLA